MSYYANKDDFAVEYNYADWTAYAAERPNSPSLANLNRKLGMATRIINRFIGCYPNNVTDSDYTEELKDLCLMMVKRMYQVEMGQGMAKTIPYFSPNDFLIERERLRLVEIGALLEYREVGRISS